MDGKDVGVLGARSTTLKESFRGEDASVVAAMKYRDENVEYQEARFAFAGSD